MNKTDAEFWQELVDLTGYIYTVVRKFGFGEDARQEVILRAYEKRALYKPGNLKGWVTALATRYCLDVLRRKGTPVYTGREIVIESIERELDPDDFDTLMDRIAEQLINPSERVIEVFNQIRLTRTVPSWDNRSDYNIWNRYIRPYAKIALKNLSSHYHSKENFEVVYFLSDWPIL